MAISFIMRKIKYILLLIFVSILQAQNAEVLTGIEVLKKDNFRQLKDLRIGLITNQTGVDNSLTSTIDLFYESENVNLVCLFGPEHGVRGDEDAGKKVKSYIDKKTGLPVYSLYGSTKKPTKEMLQNVDALVYDIQNIGCRSYTFISTMGLAMEAAAENNKLFFVLDRPNPLGGLRVEGNLTEEDCFSFISKYKIPYIYGLTCGELALMINDKEWLKTDKKCQLNIIKMQNWKRDFLYSDCNLIWVPTSPHIPKFETTFFYPATGILGEIRSDFNIGVGYTLPFEMILSDKLDSQKLTDRLNKKYNSDKISFRATSVTPYYTGFKGKRINGVQIYLKDLTLANLMHIQFEVLKEIISIKPELKEIFKKSSPQNKMFDKAIGSKKIRQFISENNFNAINSYLDKDIEKFNKDSEKYYLY